MIAHQRPTEQEYAPFYADYVALVPDGDLATLLTEQGAAVAAAFGALSPQQAAYRYAPEAWSLKQVLGHLSDVERVFLYRAAAIARGDTTPLPGFDQDVYVAAANYDERELDDLLAEFSALRQATIATLRGITPAMGERLGTVSGGPMSARALLYCIIGHCAHHLADLGQSYAGAFNA